MMKIFIPRGYIWLKDAAENFKWRYIEIKTRLKMDIGDRNFEYNSHYESLGRIQFALAQGDIVANYFGEEDLLTVSRGFWARGDREDVINIGLLAYKCDEQMPIFIETDLYKKFAAWHEEFAGISSSSVTTIDNQKPNLYVSPFIDIMLKAVAHFNITEDDAPKIDSIKEWLRDQKLPDGKELSNIQKSYMATFCRPPDRMTGGNAKSKKGSQE